MHHLYIPLIAILVVASQGDAPLRSAPLQLSTATDCVVVHVR